ncbi:hypothetical protein FA15DRAFT_694487, partial [Coprinopsis marcescibilis]
MPFLNPRLGSTYLPAAIFSMLFLQICIATSLSSGKIVPQGSGSPWIVGEGEDTSHSLAIDLAMFSNNLDLEAMPAMPNMMTLNASLESPDLKIGGRRKAAMDVLVKDDAEVRAKDEVKIGAQMKEWQCKSDCCCCCENGRRVGCEVSWRGLMSSRWYGLGLSNISSFKPHARNGTSLSHDADVSNAELSREYFLPPSIKQSVKADSKRISFVSLTRPSSAISFAGLDSFNEVRHGFEFHDYRPAFHAPPVSVPGGASMNASWATTNDSQSTSIASSAAYRRAYGHRKGQSSAWTIARRVQVREKEREKELPEVPRDEGGSEDGHGGMSRYTRQRVGSDASSFYFRAPNPRGQHRRRESNLSVSSISGMPPISMFTRAHHRKTSSVTSAGSIAISYAMHGAIGGRAVSARYRRESSYDLVASDASMYAHQSGSRNMARPWLGDTMFETEIGGDYGEPECTMRRRETGGAWRWMIRCWTSVFGNDDNGMAPGRQFRPLSIISNQIMHNPGEDDTMISMSFSMIGGGHVRRRPIGSTIDASSALCSDREDEPAPEDDCQDGLSQLVRVDVQGNELELAPLPKKQKMATLVEKPAIASTSSFQFGDDRMIKAQRGLLKRASLEDNCWLLTTRIPAIRIQHLHLDIRKFWCRRPSPFAFG